jgi:4-methyl-5(b-hydroxyethyl)-thiazole monophosphate biosynthesis
MKQVLVPLAPGFEELEAVTIIDLLRRANIDVIVAGLTEGPLTGSRGTKIMPDFTLDDLPDIQFDMIVLPGGQPGANNLGDDPRIEKLLVEVSKAGGITAAICAAPKVLASAGLLENRKMTSYPGAMSGVEVSGMVNTGDSVVVDGKVVTSRGPGTATEFTLELIEILVGEGVRYQVEEGLQG